MGADHTVECINTVLWLRGLMAKALVFGRETPEIESSSPSAVDVFFAPKIAGINDSSYQKPPT